MSDIKFACPTCQQHIQADQGYAGMEIPCPACSAKMIVPGTPVPVPVPVPVPAPVYAPPPAAPAPYAVPPPAAAGGCPSCGAPMTRGAVICTKCGYNIATKQRMVGGRGVGAAGVRAAQAPALWYKTPLPYIGAVALLFVVLYIFARISEGAKLAFLGLSLLYLLTAHIIVVIAAFKESIGKGFLALCIGIYTIYFVFKESESNTLKALYGVVILIWLALYTFKD